MPNIKPILISRNNFNEISEICHTESEPVFITKNGQGNLVVMSMALYENSRHLLSYTKIYLSQKEKYSNNRISHKNLMKELRETINGKEV